MTEQTTTASPPATSIWMKLAYSFIVLLWVVAGVVVYFTFFTEHTPQQSVVATEELSSENKAIVDEEQKTIILNSAGEEVAAEDADLLPLELPDFSLTNQSGETIGLKELKGKPWVATFVFSSCPGPCSFITGQMKELQRDLDDVDFNLVSITVDPENDDPEKLTKYADAFSADLNNWHFLTGDRSDIYSLIRRGFKMPVGETTVPGDIAHNTKFVVVDKDGNYVADYLIIPSYTGGLNDKEYHELKKKVRELAESDSEEPKSEPTEPADEADGQESK